LGREIINRVQRLRKKAGLLPTDDVKMEYTVLSDPDNIGLGDAFKSQAQAIEKVLRRQVEESAFAHDQVPSADAEGTISQEEQEVQNATFLLRLLKL
jgi:isoleucyl-tRNA synthetase